MRVTIKQRERSAVRLRATPFVSSSAAIRLAITRAQIPGQVILVNAFTVSGELAHGDIGAGALYVRGTSSGKRAVQDALGVWWNLVVGATTNLGWWGANVDGATDDFAAITAALSSGARRVVSDSSGTAYCSQTLTIPQNVWFDGQTASHGYPTAGFTLLFPNDLSVCVMMGGGNRSSKFTNAVVARPGTPSAGSIGVRNYNAYNAIIDGVTAHNHAVGFEVSGDRSSGGISFFASRLFTRGITDVDFVIDSVPEIHVAQSRFGGNGGGDVSHTAYVRVKGGSTVNAASGPNTIKFVDCQFNTSGHVGNVVEFVDMQAGSIADTGILSFIGSHIEGYGHVIKVDSSWSKRFERIEFNGTTLNSNVEFFDVASAAAGLNFVKITGGSVAGPVTVPANVERMTFGATDVRGAFTTQARVDLLVSSGTRWGGVVTLDGDANSTAIMGGDVFEAGLTVTGAWQKLAVKGVRAGGAYVNTATGKWSVELVGDNPQPWTPALSFATGGSAGFTYSTQVGRYEVRGNEVTASFQIVLSAKGSGSGNLFITGLPVPSTSIDASTAGMGGVGTYAVALTGMTGAMTFRCGSGSTQVDVFQTASTGLSRVTDANVTNVTTISGTIRYFR